MARPIDANLLASKAIVDMESGEAFVSLQDIDSTPTLGEEDTTNRCCRYCENRDVIFQSVNYIPLDNGKVEFIPLRYCPHCGALLIVG